MLPGEDGVSSPPQACSIAVDGPKNYFQVEVIYLIVEPQT